MKLTSFEDHLDRSMGCIGTQGRDDFEKEMAFSLRMRDIGSIIRQKRRERGFTQWQIGAMVGVSESQISKIESGKVLPVQTFFRILRALGATTIAIDAGDLGCFRIW